jgi:hypothetical protein
MARIKITTELLGAELIDAARRTIPSWDDAEIAALDPADVTMPIVMTDGIELLDGCHRILGMARWAEEQGLDLRYEVIEIPALHVPQSVIDVEHPWGERTPDSLVAEWTARAQEDEKMQPTVEIETSITQNDEREWTPAEILDMERQIGHVIPRPYSQTLCEDLTVMPDVAKRRGDGMVLLAMARQVHPS